VDCLQGQLRHRPHGEYVWAGVKEGDVADRPPAVSEGRSVTGAGVTERGGGGGGMTSRIEDLAGRAARWRAARCRMDSAARAAALVQRALRARFSCRRRAASSLGTRGRPRASYGGRHSESVGSPPTTDDCMGLHGIAVLRWDCNPMQSHCMGLQSHAISSLRPSSRKGVSVPPLITSLCVRRR